jgi:hypothetical protein
MNSIYLCRIKMSGGFGMVKSWFEAPRSFVDDGMTALIIEHD